VSNLPDGLQLHSHRGQACSSVQCELLPLTSSCTARPPLPQVIKRTGVQMQQRQVPAATVTSWQHRVEKLEPQVGWLAGWLRVGSAHALEGMRAGTADRPDCAHLFDMTPLHAAILCPFRSQQSFWKTARSGRCARQRWRRRRWAGVLLS